MQAVDKVGQGEEGWEEDFEGLATLDHVQGHIRQQQLEEVLIEVGPQGHVWVIDEASDGIIVCLLEEAGS